MSSQPHWRTPSFFRGVGQPPTSVIQPVLVTTLHYSNIISIVTTLSSIMFIENWNNYESVVTTSIVTTSFNSNLHYIIYHYIIENWKFCHEDRLRPLWKMSRKIAVHRKKFVSLDWGWIKDPHKKCYIGSVFFRPYIIV